MLKQTKPRNPGFGLVLTPLPSPPLNTPPPTLHYLMKRKTLLKTQRCLQLLMCTPARTYLLGLREDSVMSTIHFEDLLCHVQHHLQRDSSQHLGILN